MYYVLTWLYIYLFVYYLLIWLHCAAIFVFYFIISPYIYLKRLVNVSLRNKKSLFQEQNETYNIIVISVSYFFFTKTCFLHTLVLLIWFSSTSKKHVPDTSIRYIINIIGLQYRDSKIYFI